ncbi:MAG TPA: hypothetical protein VF796_24590 [Humisphaera sp.]
MPDDPAPTLALVKDLILGSRVSAAAAALNVPLRTVRDPARLTGAPGDRLLVDLNLDGAIGAAAAWKAEAAGRTVVGFVSHVDTETINKARDAGVDRVLARSAFVERLPQLLSGADRTA